MKLGRYELVRKLATGGMAEVFLARAEGPMGFQKTVVIKRVLSHLAEDPAFTRMFLAEAKVAALLDHPHLGQTFDFGEADGAFFLAMEYVDGLNLRVLLKRAHAAGRRLPFALCARIIAQVCEGLAHAHGFVDPATGKPMGLVHRDISPDNILVSWSGVVKVVDFGVVKVSGQGAGTEAGLLKGKVAYMPPEQIQGRPLDARADLFALGMVFYELLGGRKPFAAESDAGLLRAIVSQPLPPVTTHRADVPVALQRILERALAKDREARYATCRELHQDLERYLRTQGEAVGSFQLAQWMAPLAAPIARPSTPPAETRVAPAPSKPSLTQIAVMPWAVPPPPEPRPPEPRPPVRSAARVPRVAPGRQPRAWRLALGGVGGLALTGLGLWGWLHAGGAGPRSDRSMRPHDAPRARALAPSSSPERSALAPEAAPPEQAELSPESPGEVQGRVLPGRRPRAAASASVRIESNLRGQVRVNGRVWGWTPRLVWGLPPGAVDVEVFDPEGAFSTRHTVELGAGRNPPVRVTVAKGSILFYVRPDATTVLLDGKSLGVTPLPPIEVYEGTHALTFIHPQHGTRREERAYRVLGSAPQVYQLDLRR
ncbi:serine/threonine protein kinase [Melittangium boletus]|uniref:serine/threonine protein kinase n=1 Tax=Melittangium boletus TaxID=83453 RepID=UPI003DA33831